MSPFILHQNNIIQLAKFTVVVAETGVIFELWIILKKYSD